jgi:hypothetical protein
MMVSSSDIAWPVDQRPVQCAHCGNFCRPDDTHCSRCRTALHTEPIVGRSTRLLNRRPLVVTSQSHGSARFEATNLALLQILPSGACLPLTVAAPVTLGRTGPREVAEPDFTDLTPYNAHQHGVSRAHCLLRRRDRCLLVTDLGSTNGTYLNGELLLPHRDYVLADGDHLVLGSLHLIVFFNATKAN